MSDLPEVVSEQVEKAGESRLNSWVALTVAISATLMALGNVKDGNIVQAMAQAQANTVDQWSYYQAKGTKQNLAEATADQLTIQRDLTSASAPDARQLLDRKIAEYQDKAKLYEREKGEIKKVAEGLQAEYDRLNYRDDQFDIADACLTLCMSLMGIAALTKKRWLFGFGAALALLGIAFEVSAFLGWQLHPDFIAKLLS